MTNIFKDSRRDLRERAFQTLFALEFGGEALEQAHFAYTYDKPIDEETEVDVPAFLLSLVTGVREELAQLDSQIEEKLKESWSLSRLIVTDRTLLRLGLYEITSFEETPGPNGCLSSTLLSSRSELIRKRPKRSSIKASLRLSTSARKSIVIIYSLLSLVSIILPFLVRVFIPYKQSQ